MYKGWNRLNKQCHSCNWTFFTDPIDGMAFMYISTAAITGLFVMGFLLFGFPAAWSARLIVVGLALVIMIVTLPVRKSLAITIDYLSRRETEK